MDRVRAHLDAQPMDIAETLLWVLVLPPTQEECDEITGPPREGSKVRVDGAQHQKEDKERWCTHTRVLTTPHSQSLHENDCFTVMASTS